MDNVIDTMVECRQLNEKIPRLKWSESILDMTARLMDASIEFASQKFVNIVGSKTFKNIDKVMNVLNRFQVELFTKYGFNPHWILWIFSCACPWVRHFRAPA